MFSNGQQLAKSCADLRLTANSRRVALFAVVAAQSLRAQALDKSETQFNYVMPGQLARH